MNNLTAIIEVEQAEAGVSSIYRCHRWIQNHIIENEILQGLVSHLLMQFHVRVELIDRQKRRYLALVEAEVSMMVVTRHLNKDFVSVTNNDREESLPIVVITCIGPLRSQSIFEFDSKVDMASDDEFSIILRLQ